MQNIDTDEPWKFQEKKVFLLKSLGQGWNKEAAV